MNNSQRSTHEQQQIQQGPEPQISARPPEEEKHVIKIKPLQNFPIKEMMVTTSLKNTRRGHRRQENPHAPSPTRRNNSFSDIISPQNVQTVLNMSLEKELENHQRKSLNTMSDRSNIFEQSSIHKEGEPQKPGTPNGSDLKEHDSLLNEGLPNEPNMATNRRICILCHNSQAVQLAIKETKPEKPGIWEYDLIHPCLCNIKAHRECLKTYLLLRKIVSCERCKTGYAASGKTNREIKLPRENLIAIVITALLCLGIAIAGVVIVISFFGSSGSPVGIVGIVMILIGILGLLYLVWRKYFSKKIVDIAVYCKQTEIARHRENPDQTLKKFIGQEENKRSSRVLKKAEKIMALLDPLEFETFIKMTTPRTEKQEKIASHERHGSSNFLLSDPSKPKEVEDEEVKNKTRKEIFIAPTEIEKSENTMPDNQSNVNEFSAKIKTGAAIPQIRVTDSHPSKHAVVFIRKDLPRPRPEIRRELSTGNQQEAQVQDNGKRMLSARLVKVPLKDIQSGASIQISHGLTTREKINSPELVVSIVQQQTVEEPKKD